MSINTLSKSFSLYSDHMDHACVRLHGKKIPTEFYDPKKYERIVSELTTGWRPCRLIDYPGIFHKESEEDYKQRLT